MILPRTNDLDFLGALVHARCSTMAEGECLDHLCRLHNLSELGAAVLPGVEFLGTADFQHRLVQQLVQELSVYLGYLRGVGAEMLNWVLSRFEVENVKVLVRSLATHVPFQECQKYLVSLPYQPKRTVQLAQGTRSLEALIELLPSGMDALRLKKLWNNHREPFRPFFVEAVLDGTYFRELVMRTGRLPAEDREWVTPLVLQEVDTFHLMLALRGKFHYGLTPENLLPLHVRGTRISRGRFAEILAAPDAATAASRAGDRVMDAVPHKQEANTGESLEVAAACEALSWKRFVRLAKHAFRHGHMALGQVFGYAGLRRVEVANLITISEALRSGVSPAEIRSRLIPRVGMEASYV